MKSVSIWSFSGLYFPAFGLNMEIHSLILRIQSKYGKTQTIKIPNKEQFYAVYLPKMFPMKYSLCLSRPYSFNFFKGCLPQILLGPILNTLSQILLTQSSKTFYKYFCVDRYWMLLLKILVMFQIYLFLLH